MLRRQSCSAQTKVIVFLACSISSILAFETKSSLADITYDFSTGPITWNPETGPLSWDANGDSIHDLQLVVEEGTIDPVSGLYTIDNFSTSSGNIEKIFRFSIKPISAAAFSNCTFDLLGFDFFSEKNTEPGGKGGAGAISIDIFDDANVEQVDSINVSGNLGSAPTQVTLPSNVTSDWFELRIDLGSPPGNDDAQVILGQFIFNGGTVVCSSIEATVPEPGSTTFLTGIALSVMMLRGKRN